MLNGSCKIHESFVVSCLISSVAVYYLHVDQSATARGIAVQSLNWETAHTLLWLFVGTGCWPSEMFPQNWYCYQPVFVVLHKLRYWFYHIADEILIVIWPEFIVVIPVTYMTLGNWPWSVKRFAIWSVVLLTLAAGAMTPGSLTIAVVSALWGMSWIAWLVIMLLAKDTWAMTMFVDN